MKEVLVAGILAITLIIHYNTNSEDSIELVSHVECKDGYAMNIIFEDNETVIEQFICLETINGKCSHKPIPCEDRRD